MTTSGSALRAQLIAAVRGATVATAAGVAALTWASTTVPRVFDGSVKGFIGGRNRGRCPFVEIEVDSQGFSSDTIDGGMLTSTVRLRIHATTRFGYDVLDAIAVASLAAMRATPSFGYTAQGDDSIGVPDKGPMGWVLEVTVTVEHSYSRTTYEAT